MKKKVIVSACILGEICRYDGKSKKIQSVLEVYKNDQIIPFCPEAPLFGTPRERISVVQKNGKNRIITDETKVDVTLRLKEEIEHFIQENPDVDAIILKSKSPSCGYKTTPILNEKREVLELGNGIAAGMFELHYKDISIKDENL